MTTAPLVDVLIPVYNGHRWLAEAVRSIQQQSHRALRIHVVDDGSTDGTPGLLLQLAAQDSRIRIHSQANGGIVSALNFGLRFCTAEFIARHDADDVAYPLRLERQLRHLLDNPGCVAVGAMARHIDGDGHALGSVTALRPPAAADARWFPAREPYLMHPLLLVRRQALLDAGRYRQVLHAEDSDLYWRLRELGSLHNLPQLLADYRVHGGSISSASLHNGRVMAVSSQLAALSAQRRAVGVADLTFDAAQAARLRGAGTLQAMVQSMLPALNAAERTALPLAASAKLLELASYQPFELDAGDCRYVAAAMHGEGRALASAANRRALGRAATRAALRLWAGGRARDAMTLLGPAQWPAFACRYALRKAMPTGLRQRLHGWLHRGATP